MSDQDEVVTPRSSILSSGASFPPSISSNNSQISAKTAVIECSQAWICYLQVLNNLCATGSRLSQCISALEQCGHQTENAGTNAIGAATLPGNLTMGCDQTPTHFTGCWEDLAKATAVATSTVKSHVVSMLQEFITTNTTSAAVVEQEADSDSQRTREHNQQIIMGSAQTLINLQHQFCVASYESFSALMCCCVCQAPVGFVHDPECGMITQQKPSDPRSQTPSPNFGAALQQKAEKCQQGDATRGILSSGSTQGEQSYNICGKGLEQTRGTSPHQEVRGPSPIQGFLENIRGPLPNPGHLLGMKAPFYRGSRSPLNFPLFPINGQRRWSEAAAGEVRGGESAMDIESQMRRWSMPWEASKTDNNTVTWHQTKIMPTSKLALPSKASSDRSQSTTPDSFWQSSITSQDGLAEAIQLLSFRPARSHSVQHHIISPQGPPQSGFQPQHLAIGQTFVEEPATYEMWSTGRQDRLQCNKFQFPPKREGNGNENGSQ